MTSALIEIFANAWDTLFNKHPRLGSGLKIVLICIISGFLFYGFQTQSDYAVQNDKQQDANFETIANQNMQLLKILEAQNALFSERIETLENRQYELQKDIVTLIKEGQNRQQLSRALTLPNEPEIPTGLSIVSTPIDNVVDARSEQITESINVLKSQMTSEIPNGQSSDDEQAQQPAGH